MATVIFFEKPGCGNNMKQKMWLAASGHRVLVKDLLKEKWRKDELRMFFDGLPVADWFNRSSPDIKSGRIDPEKIDAETALSMMVAQPLLIRRPLIKVGDVCRAGFDEHFIRAWIGLSYRPSADLETCLMAQAPCPPPP